LRGAAYYPEHREECCWESDLRNMQAANLNAVRVGEFAWKRFEPRDGEYVFDWMDRFNRLAARYGIGLVLCPPIRTLPAWLVERDPTVLLQRADGVRLAYGSRYTFCINHPLLQQKGEALAEAMAAHFGAHSNVLAWHLDNEHGDELDCHCPLCADAFREWCRRRYSDIDALNRCWGTVFWGLEYDRFEQIPTPGPTCIPAGPGHQLAWRRFRSDATVALVELQARAVRRGDGGRLPTTTNHQPSWNMRNDYAAMGREAVDISGLNYYPSFGEGGAQMSYELARCRGYKQAPFLIHELRCGPHMIPGRPDNQPAAGEIERLAVHCVAHGANGVFFYRWKPAPFGVEQTHGSIADYDGRPTRVHGEVAALYRRIQRLDPFLAGSDVIRQTAILFDLDSEWVLGQENAWLGPNDLQQTIARRCYESLLRNRFSVDVVGRAAAWDDYRLLLLPCMTVVDDELAARLVRYTERGGTLVAHPLSGLRDDEARIDPHRMHESLRALFGIEPREFRTASEGLPMEWSGGSDEGQWLQEAPSVFDAECFGSIAGVPQGPVWTARRAGQGRAIFLCTYGSETFYERWLKQLAMEASLEPSVPEDVPDTLEVVQRTGPNGDLLFLLNRTNRPLEISWPGGVGRDVYRDEPRVDRLSFCPYGVRVLLHG